MHAYQPERLNNLSNSNNLAVQAISEHPGLCAGAGLSLVVMASIFVNAVWYQSGKHPSPMFSTRGETLVKTLAVGSNEQAPKSSLTTASIGPMPDQKQEETKASKQEVLREVQSALSVRGYYSGKLDGVYGSRTEKAIKAFQRDHSLKEDGKSNARLLTQVLMSASSRPQEAPVQEAVVTTKPKPVVKAVAVSKPQVVPQADGLIAQIQSGLKTYGYDDIKVDGKMGQQTATAIQRFQLDYGMKITGEPSDQVLQKLQDIGAYKNG